MVMMRHEKNKHPLVNNSSNNNNSNNKNTMPTLGSLSEDELAHVLSFLDLTSAVTLTQRVSKKWRRQHLSGSSGAFPALWREFFDRQAFSSQDMVLLQSNNNCRDGVTDAVQHFLNLCKYRRILLQTLFGRPPSSRQRHQLLRRGQLLLLKQNCSYLPDRLYSFLPVIPYDDLTEDDGNIAFSDDNLSWDRWWKYDPPPVHYACDSFILTSTAVRGELLFLNPFSNSLVLYKSCLDNVILSDETRVEHAMRDASLHVSANKNAPKQPEQVDPVPSQRQESSSSVREEEERTVSSWGSPWSTSSAVTLNAMEQQQQQQHYPDELQLEAAAPAPLPNSNVGSDNDLELVATAISDRVHRTPPQHVFVSAFETVLDVDLHNYFWWSGQDNNGSMDEEVEVDIDYLGIDASPVLRTCCQDGQWRLTATTMFSLFRAISSHYNNSNNNHPHHTTPLDCLEILAWFRDDEAAANATITKFVCRMYGDFHFAVCCASQRRVYVNPKMTLANRGEQEEEEHLAGTGGTHQVFAYPLEEYHYQSPPQSACSSSLPPLHPPKYFPKPSLILNCKGRVSTLGVCATGTRVVVATTARTMLLWNIIDSDAHSAPAAELEQTISLPRAVSEAFQSNGHGGLWPITRQVAESPVVAVFCPKAMPMDACGFCTLHSNQIQGHSVLVWHKTRKTTTLDGMTTAASEWQLHTMINLPLSALRVPALHYDGNRLIVYGQDHIGFIILVYQVSSTLEHLVARNSTTTTSAAASATSDHATLIAQEDSGGVFHATATPRVRFVNRIRHAALSGMEAHESLLMTCNERYIVVNTKTGNLLSGGTTPFREGLLIIDLEQDHRH